MRDDRGMWAGDGQDFLSLLFKLRFIWMKNMSVSRHCVGCCHGSRRSETHSQVTSNQLVAGGVGETHATQHRTEFAIYLGVVSRVW